MFKTLPSVTEVNIPSLVRELRPHMPRGVAKKREKREVCVVTVMFSALQLQIIPVFIITIINN